MPRLFFLEDDTINPSRVYFRRPRLLRACTVRAAAARVRDRHRGGAKRGAKCIIIIVIAPRSREQDLHSEDEYGTDIQRRVMAIFVRNAGVLQLL